MVSISIARESGRETTRPAKAEPRIEEVRLDDLDRSLQVRASLNEEAIEDYRAMIEEGTELDPGIAYRLPDGRLALVAGFHRAEAYRRAGRDTMLVDIRDGSMFWAIRAGIVDNNQHKGVRLTRSDRQKAVKLLLESCPTQSDGIIAATAGVDRGTVIRHRRRMEADGTCCNTTSRVGSDGREISTARIGQRVAEEPAQADEINPSLKLGSQSTDAVPVVETEDLPMKGAEDVVPIPVKGTPSACADPVTEGPPVTEASENHTSETGTAREANQELGGTVESTADQADALFSKIAELLMEVEVRLKEAHVIRPGLIQEARERLNSLVAVLSVWSYTSGPTERRGGTSASIERS